MTYAPILYIEDSTDDAFFMKVAFRDSKIPYPLMVLSDGSKGIHYLSGQGEFADRVKNPMPRLVLLDLNLPIRSGFEVLQWIRGEPGLKNLPVVVISASGQQLDIDLAKKYGITDYIVKPATVSGLTSIVSSRITAWLYVSSVFESEPDSPF